jgi:hypothetical protein
MLIIMEHRDLHALLELRLDLETLRSFDVFKVDAAECRLQRGDGFNHAFDRVGGNFDIEDIDTGELLEQHRLAFHDGLRGERPDIAKTEDSGAVGDYGDQIASNGQRRRL